MGPHISLGYLYGLHGTDIIFFLKSIGIEVSVSTAIHAFMSDWMPVISGIPQGSVLGPVLFVCFINDLPDGVSSLVHMYADDTKLGRRIESTADNLLLQTDLNSLTDWSSKWQLRFNASKCKVLNIGSRRHFVTHAYTMEENGQSVNLETTTEERDLGIWMDSSLKFDGHVARAVSRANTVMGMIKRSFVHMDIPMLRQLYMALVRPLLEYGVVVWNPRFKKDIDMLESVRTTQGNKINTCAKKFEL